MMVLASIFLILAVVVVGWHVVSEKKLSNLERVGRISAAYPNACIRHMLLQKQLWQGMTEVELIDCWGQPKRVTQKVLGRHVRQTFRYGSNLYGSSVYLEGDRVTGWRH